MTNRAQANRKLYFSHMNSVVVEEVERASGRGRGKIYLPANWIVGEVVVVPLEIAY